MKTYLFHYNGPCWPPVLILGVGDDGLRQTLQHLLFLPAWLGVWAVVTGSTSAAVRPFALVGHVASHGQIVSMTGTRECIDRQN